MAILKINNELELVPPFGVGRGVRQGCPLSGILYTLSLEPFLNTLRKSLSGLTMGTNPLKSIAYADDICVCINHAEDIVKMTSTLDLFGKASSARINWAKTEALWLQPSTYPLSTPLSLFLLVSLAIFLGKVTGSNSWECFLVRRFCEA